MNRCIIITVILVIALLQACGDKDNPSNSGTVTINNELSGTGPYYALGFSITHGKKVSTLSAPLDVVTILEDNDVDMTVRMLYFTCENFENSFFRYGEYADAATAKSTFDNLKSFTEGTWTATADSVRANQIWLFRTSGTSYAKIRVISTHTEIKTGMVFPYAECTFEYVYQPDGTKLFP